MLRSTKSAGNTRSKSTARLVGQEGGQAEGTADAVAEAKPGAATSITIEGGELRREGPELDTARQSARLLVAAVSDAGDTVSNPIVERMLARLQKARPSEQCVVAGEGVGVIKCSVAAPPLERLGIILNRVAQTALTQGFKLDPSDNSALFECGTETVGFSVSEQIKRGKHLPTDAEQEKLAAWERKRDRQTGRGP